MATRIAELRQQRAGLVDQLRGMLDKASGEGRDLTPAETTKYDDLMAKVETMGKDISRREGLRDVEHELDQPLGHIQRNGAWRGDGSGRLQDRQAIDGPGIYFRTEDNQVLRAVRHGEPLEFRSIQGQPDEGSLSMDRWLQGVISGDWSNAQDELRAQRAMATTLDVSGGYAVPTSMAANIINLARNKAKVMASGALTVPMPTQEVTMVKVTGDPTAYWKAEDAEATESSMTLGLIRLRSRTLVGLVKMTYEQYHDAPNLVGTVERALSDILSLEMDRVALYGSGAAEEPTGLYNCEDVNVYSMGTNGATMASTGYTPFSRAVQYIYEANSDGARMSAIYAPRTAGEIDRLLDGNSNPLTPPASFVALKKHITNQVATDQTQGSATNASDAFVGDFRQMVFAIREGLTIRVSDQASDSSSNAFSQMEVWIRAHMRLDIGVLQESQFCIIKGIIPPS